MQVMKMLKPHVLFHHIPVVKGTSCFGFTSIRKSNQKLIHLFCSTSCLHQLTSSYTNTSYNVLRCSRHRGLFSPIEICLRISAIRTFTTQPDSSNEHSVASILDRFQKLENSFRYHGYSTLRIGLAFTAIAGFGLYIFREPIRENVVEEVTQMASRSLGDEQVVYKAEEFSKGLLNAIANDDRTLKLAVSFVQEVLNREETRMAASQLVHEVLGDEETQKIISSVSKDLVIATLNDPKIKDEFVRILKQIIRSDDVMESVRDLLRHVLQREEVREMMAEFFQSVLATEVVVEQAAVLGKEVAKQVISDETIQEQAGNSMWKAITFSLIPGWFTSSTSPVPSDGTG